MDLKIYTCNICNKDYKTYKSMWHHKNKYHIKTSTFYPQNINTLSTSYPQNTHNLSTINPEPKKTEQSICINCNKKLSCYKSLHRHLKNCKENINLKEENDKLKKDNDEYKKILLDLMNKKFKMHPKKLQKIINNNTNNNTNNNSNNINNLTINNNINNINIIELGDEELYKVFSKEEKINILKSGYSSLEEIIKHTHLNDSYLQFQNIIITNKTEGSNNQAYVYNSKCGRFILCNKKELLEELIIYRMDDLVSFYDEYKNKLTPKLVKILEEMFNVKKNDNEYIDRKNREFNILFYNMCNKNLIKYTKNNELDNMINDI
jgi:hypothetical protein